MRSKIFGIAFLFLLVVPVTTVFFVLKSQQRQVRSEVKWRMIAGIDKSELELLKFSKAEIEQKLLWKHNREFQYQGEFYDVVQKETRGDSIFYWCWWDQEETELEKKLQKLVASHWNHDPIQKNKKDTIQKLFKHLFHETAAAFQNMSFFNPGCQAFWNYLESKPEINILQHDPPPRFLFQALQP